MSRLHYNKFGEGRPACGISFIVPVTRDLRQVTRKRCLWSSDYNLPDSRWILLSKALTRLFRRQHAGEHAFRDGGCR